MRMRLIEIIAISAATICAVGCVSRPVTVIPPDCLWSDQITWTTADADAIVDCCPEVARQMLAHNAKHRRLCDG